MLLCLCQGPKHRSLLVGVSGSLICVVRGVVWRVLIFGSSEEIEHWFVLDRVQQHPRHVYQPV